MSYDDGSAELPVEVDNPCLSDGRSFLRKRRFTGWPTSAQPVRTASIDRSD